MQETRKTIALLGGALAGAAAMYLLDPEAGRKRRAYLQKQAERAWNSAEHAIHEGVEGVTHRVGDVSHLLAQKANQARDYLGSTSSQAQDYANQAGKAAHGMLDYSQDLWQQVRGLGQKFGSRAQSAAEQARACARSGFQPQHTSSLVPVTLTALGCWGIGMGLMYLLSGKEGRATWHWLADSISSFAHRAGNTFQNFGSAKWAHAGHRYPRAAASSIHEHEKHNSPPVASPDAQTGASEPAPTF